MQHITMKATTTDTDTEQGTFTALASAWVADREGDVIERTAFDETIRAWRTSQKNLPLLAEHSTTVVGAIDPASMHATDEGLVVAGEVDRESDEGKAAWRMIKSGIAGFSIGFMAESKPRKGGRTITEIDLLEVSVTAVPVHQSTRALSWKSAGPATIREQSRTAALADGDDLADLSLDELKARGDALTKALIPDTRPVRIASFEC